MFVKTATMSTWKSNWSEYLCIQKYWQNKYLLLCITEVFLNTCFYSSGTRVSWMFSLSQKQKKFCISLIQNAFLWSNPIIFDSGDLEALCLWLLCQIIPIFSVVQLNAAAGYDKPEQSVGALSPLSDALPLYHHHLRPFPPRPVSRFLLSQKQDSCFDNGYCGSHQMQEAFKINLLKILLIFKSRSTAKTGSSSSSRS